MKNYLLLILLSLLSISCTSSGVIRLGPETYTISTTNELSPAWAKKQALEEATKYCKSLRKQVMPVQTRHGSFVDSMGDNIATFDYTFRCLRPGDQDLGRPELKDPTMKLKIDQNIKEEKDVQIKSDSDETDLYKELNKLKQLKDDGVITDQEFQELKRKAIERY